MKSKTENQISLRKFPFPFQAMFAICSDVDHAISLPAYLDFMRFLNTDQQTSYGKGVSLEISNSFWFYNAVGDEQLSYFQGTSDIESEFAGVCRDFWNSGHIDTLHGYGDFNRGGFERHYAEQALEELDKWNVKIPVWVNHGNDNNHQKLGNYPGFDGANPSSKAYHFDLLREHGTRFYWAGRTTHVCGQRATFSLGHAAHKLLQSLVVKTKYRHIDRPLPDPLNRLLIPAKQTDGGELFEFQRFISRYGQVKNTDLHDLSLQLTRGNLSTLVKNEGYMLLYTHMNEHLPEQQALPAGVEAGFRLLSEYSQAGDLLVTTSSRLLQYADIHEQLAWETKFSSDQTQIHLSRLDDRPLVEEALQGITLYCTEPEKITLFCGEKQLSLKINPIDSSGKPSVSVVWEALEFPV
ncbi:MAG: hypothetical protein H8E26_02595 [FCB group bacterium]|nr:hypothetical protein [FCB group bacterium]MBL7027274.1 hypothetical protein [Candidatus Neomarinimicrobiota bacterium]MBL7122244.1 hypothetical protein [Candidatus Neomarinimicrobiota bacterium]